MEFKQIVTFVALADYLHFGKAAEHLQIAQPHVSRRIKQLEEELDVLLFYRNKRNVRLTEAGEVFLAEARKLLHGAELARERTRESSAGRRGRLNVSLISSAMLGVVPTILGTYRRAHPDVLMKFTEVGTAVQLEGLNRGTADVAFVHPPIRRMRIYDQVVLEREPLLAVLPKTHRLAAQKHINLYDLANDPWVMFPRDNSTPIYDRIISICNRAGFSPNIVQEAGPVYTRLGLVAAGFGVHLVHKAWETMPYPGVVYIPTYPTATVGLACYWRKGDPNPILHNFIDIVRKHRLQERVAA